MWCIECFFLCRLTSHTSAYVPQRPGSASTIGEERQGTSSSRARMQRRRMVASFPKEGLFLFRSLCQRRRHVYRRTMFDKNNQLCEPPPSCCIEQLLREFLSECVDNCLRVCLVQTRSQLQEFRSKVRSLLHMGEGRPATGVTLRKVSWCLFP